jgi:prepilin-type N-terminal cleavage/methylation domain-containing protein
MRRQNNLQNKKAFTMFELVMVIAILGIVSSIGSAIIVNIYEHYLLQRATHRASIKTELAAQQIANLLSHRVPGTTLARNPNDLSDNLLVTDPTNASDDTHTLLEWIGTDGDGFNAATRPPWNGFCDVDPSTQADIITPGSDLTLANTIMSNLSNAEVTLSGPQYPAIFFRDDRYTHELNTSTIKRYDVLDCMGMISNDTTCISAVGSSADETLTFQNPGSAVANKVIAEHYKLAWSAYAIRPVPRDNTHFDLVLYYNYQPWHGENLNGGWPATSATLITNITVFKFAESGNTFRFKLCAQESIGEDYNVTICKEKAIIL